VFQPPTQANMSIRCGSLLELLCLKYLIEIETTATKHKMVYKQATLAETAFNVNIIGKWMIFPDPPIDSASRGKPDHLPIHPRLPRKICSSSRRHRRLSPGQRRTATSTWLQDADLITVG